MERWWEWSLLCLKRRKIEGKRRSEWQRMRWLDDITDSVDMNVSKLREILKDRGDWCAAVHGVAKSQTRLSNWTTATTLPYRLDFCRKDLISAGVICHIYPLVGTLVTAVWSLDALLVLCCYYRRSSSIFPRKSRWEGVSLRTEKRGSNTQAPWLCVKVKVAQSCPALCNPMVYLVHGTLQYHLVHGILYWSGYSLLQGIFPT